MSTFAVVVSDIKEIKTHSNADKLELGKIEGSEYQFVVGKGEFKPGDKVVYFPIDSILPKELSDYFNVTNFLSGKDKNRIKTVKLRGEISQGLVLPYLRVMAYLNEKNNGMGFDPKQVDFTETLGVTKYEPPAILERGGNLVRLPEFVPVYDIEGCDNYPEVVEYLMDKKIWVSEKMEGMNFSIAIDLEGKIYVNQRNYSIEEIENGSHTFWKYSRERGLIDLLQHLQKNDFPNSLITLRGEFLGGKIQANFYDLKDFEVKLFDLEVNRKPLNVEDFINILNKYGKINSMVPILAFNVTLREFLNGKSVQEASNGQSVFNPNKIREGIVIKPMIEERVDIGKFKGRLFIKQRSPLYLAKTDF